MVDFPGAKDWEFLKMFQIAGCGQIGKTLGLDGFSNLIKLQILLVGSGDEDLTFIGIGTGDYGNLTVLAVMGEGTGQSVLDGGEADHFAADLGKAFGATLDAVSYTHLTLPTICSV